MRKFYSGILLAFVAMFFSIASYSQVNVTATAGTTGPTAYTTLKAAFDAVNAGTHQGAVVIEIAANTTETAACILNSSGAGSASYTSVLIRPSADGVSVSGAGSGGGTGLIVLNGADNVTIDGDNPNTTGINRNLTIQNSSIGTYHSIIRIALATSVVTTAENNAIRNVVLIGGAAGRNVAAATSTTGTENTTWGILLSANASTTSATTAPGNITSTTTTIGSPATATNLVIENNTITNVARGIALNASATSVLPGLQIKNNIIGNSTAGATDGVYSIGITAQGSANGIISGNTIYVEGYLGTSIRGLDVGTISANGTFTIENNNIQRVKSNSGGGWGAYGINLAAGNNCIVRNNFVAGIINSTASSTAFSTTFGAFGIRVGAGTGHSIYHNSVHLTGSNPGTGSGLTTAFGITGSALTGVNVRNNIFSNVVGGGGTQSAHTSIYLPSGATSSMNLTLNNNAYYQGSSTGAAIAQAGTTQGTGVYLASNFNALATTPASNLRAYTSTLSAAGTNDNSSQAYSTAAPFASATDLHINTGTTPTSLESGGATVGVTTDIDNQTRPGPAGSVNGGGVAPDIGADEFDGVPQDAVAPLITYTGLSFTCSTADRVLSGVTISDLSGVPTTGSLVPRIYYRKGAGTWYSQPGTLTSGTATNGTWSFTIVVADMGGVAANDVIQYYVIAQDAIGNIGSSPTGVTATNVNTVSVHPASPSSYSVSATLSGTFTVGATGTYTTLTAAVNAYNNSCLTGPVVFELIDATYSSSETFPVAINANPFGNTTNTLTIRPASGVNATISGSSAVAIIRLIAADYVTIDGSNNGSNTRNLSITNTNTGTSSTVVWLNSTAAGDGATNNIIKNLNIAGQGPLTTFGGIISSGTTVGGVAEGANSNNSFINNQITKSQYGLAIVGSASIQTNITATDNIIGSATASDYIGFVGMFVSNTSNSSFNKNRIFNIITTAGNPTGINIAAGVTNSTFDGNDINTIRYTGINGFGGKGININTGVTNSSLRISNNFVSAIGGDGWNALGGDGIVGIRILGTTGGVAVDHNTVNLTGSFAGNTTGTQSAAFHIASTVTGISLRNNIFVTTLDNTATTSDKTWAINSAAPNTAFTVIDHNDYYVSGAAGVLGFIGSDRATLADIQTGFGGNANSKNIQPVFFSDINLHLLPSGNVPLDNLGTPIAGITSDIDGNTRSATTPDMGADEFTGQVCPVITISPSAPSICNGQNVTLTANSTNASYTYSWAPGALTGNSVLVSPTSTTTYTITATDASGGAFTGCIVTGSVQVLVNPTPAAPVVTTANTNVCVNQNVVLQASTNSSPTLFTEKFDGATVSMTVVNGTPHTAGSEWTLRTSPYASASATFSSPDNSKFMLTDSDASGTGSTTNTSLLSPILNTTGYSSLKLKFNHHYRNLADSAVVEISTNGTTWTVLRRFTATTGTASAFAADSVDLSAYVNNSSVQVRFRYKAAYDWYWAIDDVEITGAPLNYAWSVTPTSGAGLPAAVGTPSVSNGSVTAVPTAAGTYTYTVTSSTGAGCSNTGNIVITVNGAPAITSQPQNTAVCSGTTASFSVTATGAGLTYQWRKGGTNITSATSSTLTINNATVADAGNYDVVITGTCAPAVTSNVAVLTINAATTITTQPQSQSVCTGNNVTLTVAASGGTLTYQWRKGGVDIIGANAATYTINNVAAGDAGSYDVVVTGSCGSVTSNAATISINASPLITSQPVNQTVCNGGNATFSVTATGSGLTYQWRRNGTNIAGATNSSLTINNVTNANAGNYDVVINSACNTTITSSVATLTVNQPPAITTQPQSLTACFGNTVSFSVTATGAGLTYQWRKGGTNITSATSSTLTINNVAAGDIGNYDVVVSGTCSPAVTSSVASLALNATNTWTGTTSTDWNTASNWCAGVPTSASDVIILSGTPFAPTVNANSDTRTITINAGATVTVTTTGNLNVYGNIVNNGTLNTTAGTLSFRGATNQSIPTVNAANVVMNGAGGITLGGSMTVGSALTLTNGNITLGNTNITLNNSANGSAASHIVTNGSGAVVMNNVVGSAVIPIGATATSYNAVSIGNGQGRNYTVRVAVGINPAIANSNLAINRTWTITPSTAVTSPVNVSLLYADADANGSANGGASMEVGVHNGNYWLVTTPTGGVTPSGSAAARTVSTQTTQFGPMVVANVNGILSGSDPDVINYLLMPNITSNRSTLRINTRRAMSVEWTVVDAGGRVVLRFSNQLNAGQNDITLSLAKLAAGIYHMYGVTPNGKTNTIRFVRAQ